MIINTSNTNLSANTARSERLTRKNEQTFTNARTGNVRYFSNSFEATYDERYAASKNKNTEQDETQKTRDGRRTCEHPDKWLRDDGTPDEDRVQETPENRAAQDVWGRRPVTAQDQLLQAREFMNRLRMYIMSIRERIFGKLGITGSIHDFFGTQTPMYGMADYNMPYAGAMGGSAQMNAMSVLSSPYFGLTGRTDPTYGMGNYTTSYAGMPQNGIYDLRSGSGGGANVWHRVDHTTYEYHEEEQLTFATTGQVQTADGRTIDFDLEMNLSREYTQQSDQMIEGVEVLMTDPIVISLDGMPPGISDHTWSFDIDADGIKDNIAELAQGAGFLAYDRNGDGVINDGSELFGARTGNGFAELSELDSDGNGWIDEADEAYDKLSVWVKDVSGADRLMSLREAKVGAILLDSLRTDFSHKSKTDNSLKAQVRRSGMYLTEDGLARGLQQMDFVKTA